MQWIKRNNFPKIVLDRLYEVNGIQTPLRDFLNANFYKTKVNRIRTNQARSVVDLEPGEVIIINQLEIKRIS